MASNRFAGLVRKGVGAIRDSYNQQKKAAEGRAEQRIASAKTKAERDRIKADLEVEKLRLQQEAFEARARVVKARADVEAAKRKAGVVPLSERAAGFFKTVKKGIQGSPRKKPKKRKSTRK